MTNKNNNLPIFMKIILILVLLFFLYGILQSLYFVYVYPEILFMGAGMTGIFAVSLLLLFGVAGNRSIFNVSPKYPHYSLSQSLPKKLLIYLLCLFSAVFLLSPMAIDYQDRCENPILCLKYTGSRFIPFTRSRMLYYMASAFGPVSGILLLLGSTYLLFTKPFKNLRL